MNMPSVATRVPYAQEDGFVLPPGFLQSFVAPRIPVNRVMGMLLMIWADFVNQTIWPFLSHLVRPV